MFTDLEQRKLETSSGTVPLLIVSPRDHVRMGFERLDMMEVTGGEHGLDLEVVAQVTGAGVERAVLVFLGQSAGGCGSWSFEPRVPDERVADLARRFLCAQLVTFRRLVELGVALFVHAEFGERETEALTTEAARLTRDLASRADRSDVETIDLDILRDRLLFSTESQETVLKTGGPVSARLDRLLRV